MRLSMNDYLKKIVSVLLCAILSAVFIVALFFCAPEISTVPEAEGQLTYRIADHSIGDTLNVQKATGDIGKDVTAVRINDLNKLSKITRVNYAKDKFVKPDTLAADTQIVDLTKPFDFGERGTLTFVILNLDPWSENFTEIVDELEEYKIGDYWHFTLRLPEIFCASNIYVKSKLVAMHGEIENYDFIDYNTSYTKKTEKLNTLTESTLIDLDFYCRRQSMDDAFSAAQTVTIHYQSTGGSYSGINGIPLIGDEKAVKNICEHSQNLLLAFAILSAVVLAVFTVFAALEHFRGFNSEIIWIFGIFLMLLSRFLLRSVLHAPLVWAGFALASSFIILGGALLSVGINIRKLPLKYIFPALMAAGALLAFLQPFVPFGAAGTLKIACTVIKAAGVAALTVLIGLGTFVKSYSQNYGVLHAVCGALIAVAIIASLFLPQIFPTYLNPMFWMCVVTTVTTFLNVFMIFREMKKSNAYLTDNLHLEVERQLIDLKAVINERDNLLQFVSHDMRKPLASSVSLLETAIEREKDAEQIKTLKIIKQNDSRVVTNLSEIGAYAKFNYIAEPSRTVDLSELCKEICSFHSFDCNANGIILKNSVNGNLKIFAKKQGLENAISNIIMNAVEHANCTKITLSAKTVKNKIVLSVSDDGKGIDSEMDIFKPYVTEKVETGGVGLYICKNIIESMNGTLTYESEQGRTAFFITLLKA